MASLGGLVRLVTRNAGVLGNVSRSGIRRTAMTFSVNHRASLTATEDRSRSILPQNPTAPRANQVRHYSAKAPMTLELIRERVILVLKLYDKIDHAKVSQSPCALGSGLQARLDRWKFKDETVLVFIFSIGFWAFLYSKIRSPVCHSTLDEDSKNWQTPCLLRGVQVL
ncbi:uncharacterized protein LOC124183408 isoform X1 [Neodiprion fabricii]|uniref:uncharacterized protein LOC124183408 isoform X1 n=1 Tax=Neodiprion fabricii TaxID=2872261 RepID=UPI001ED93825|nr:uncharacterized protein LOC124183408 isoform X1 [Neodiprion fabricii]